jgi:hypothetical protein
MYGLKPAPFVRGRERLWSDAEGGEGEGKRLGLEDHAFAAAEGAVVDGAVAVVGEGAEIVDMDGHQSFALGAAHDAVLEDALEEGGEDGDDVETHAAPGVTAPAIPGLNEAVPKLAGFAQAGSG